MVCILSFSEISPKSNSASSPCKKLFIKLVICQGTRCYLAKFTICFEQSCLCDWVQCPLSAASARPRPTAACGRADSEAVPWAGSPAAVCWGAAPEGAVCWEDAARAEEGGAGRWGGKGIVIGSAWKMSQREDSGRAGVGRVLAGVASPFSQLYPDKAVWISGLLHCSLLPSPVCSFSDPAYTPSSLLAPSSQSSSQPRSSRSAGCPRALAALRAAHSAAAAAGQLQNGCWSCWTSDRPPPPYFRRKCSARHLNMTHEVLSLFVWHTAPQYPWCGAGMATSAGALCESLLEAAAAAVNR